MQRDIQFAGWGWEKERAHLINSRLNLHESFVIRWLHFLLFSAKNCRNKYLITDLYTIGAIKSRWSKRTKWRRGWSAKNLTTSSNLSWNWFMISFFPFVTFSLISYGIYKFKCLHLYIINHWHSLAHKSVHCTIYINKDNVTQ